MCVYVKMKSYLQVFNFQMFKIWIYFLDKSSSVTGTGISGRPISMSGRPLGFVPTSGIFRGLVKIKDKLVDSGKVGFMSSYF